MTQFSAQLRPCRYGERRPVSFFDQTTISSYTFMQLLKRFATRKRGTDVSFPSHLLPTLIIEQRNLGKRTLGLGPAPTARRRRQIWVVLVGESEIAWTKIQRCMIMMMSTKRKRHTRAHLRPTQRIAAQETRAARLWSFDTDPSARKHFSIIISDSWCHNRWTSVTRWPFLN